MISEQTDDGRREAGGRDILSAHLDYAGAARLREGEEDAEVEIVSEDDGVICAGPCHDLRIRRSGRSDFGPVRDLKSRRLEA